MRKHLYIWAKVIVGTICVIVFAPFGWWSIAFAGMVGWRFGWSFLFLIVLGIIPMLWAAHILQTMLAIIGAWLGRLDVTIAKIGPIMIIRFKGKNITSWAPSLTSFDTVRVVSRDCHALWLRMMALSILGPIANLFMAVVCFQIAAASNRTASDRSIFEDAWPVVNWFFHALDAQSREAAWFAVGGLVNGFLGVLTFVSCWLEMVFNWPRIKFELLFESLKVKLWNGIRPNRWDSEMVESLLALRDGSRKDAKANLYGYYFELDVGDVSRAIVLLDGARTPLSRCPPDILPMVLVEAAFVESRFRRNPMARDWLNEVKQGQVEEHTRLRAEAAVLFAEGRQAEAQAAAEAAIAAVIQSMDPGGAIAEAEWLHELLCEIKIAHAIRAKDANIMR